MVSHMSFVALVSLAFVRAIDGAGDLVSAGSGWASFGIAGLILAWLFLRHLPDKDKQQKDLIDSKDSMLKTLVADYGGREDRRAAEQLAWRTEIIAEMAAQRLACIEEAKNDRHALANEMQKVCMLGREVEQHVVNEVQKLAGWTNPTTKRIAP